MKVNTILYVKDQQKSYDFSMANGVRRAELYFSVDDVETYFTKAIKIGGKN